MSQLLKGAPVAQALMDKLAAQVTQLDAPPTLAIVRLGEREDDLSYQRGATKRCAQVGVKVEVFALPDTASQEEVLAVIQNINRAAHIHGCLLLRPLPAHLDEWQICQTLDPAKDVDGITQSSLARVFTGQGQGYPPCTAQAVVEILSHYEIPVAGKEVVVVGRSLVVGRPAAMLLMAQNATVTLCHTRTTDLPNVCRRGEILVVAAGKMGVVDHRYIGEHQVVVDVGIHFDPAEQKLKGDVDFASAEPVAGAITPVPGGVGAVTTAILVSHVVQAAQAQQATG